MHVLRNYGNKSNYETSIDLRIVTGEAKGYVRDHRQVECVIEYV